MKDIGIYIHMPFCKQKCYYCDFVSYSGAENLIEEYIRKLNEELNTELLKIKNYNVKTIYIGGGTPSLCSKEDFEKIDIKKYVMKDTEFTIEINPGSASYEKLKLYKEIGVNRLSIGMQSTNNKILKEIGRIHTYEEFLEIYQIARNLEYKNINVDVMIGLPNQSVDDVEETITKVVNLNPEHISVYSLILEEGTKLEKLVEEGILKLPSEDDERKMYWKVKEILEKAGYIHYEISNFSKPGFESKHNMDCWSQKEYIGIGVSAHSYLNKTRYSNTNNLKRYIIENNFKNLREIEEVQNIDDEMKQYMLLNLRKIEGVRISKFKEKFIKNPIFWYKEELNKLVKKELIEIEADSIKLTNKGIDFANIVWEEFV